MKIQKEKIIIILTVFIDVLGLGIIIPILPFYVESFGVSAFTVTALFSVFSLFSFISAPMLGALSDKIGRRPVLILSIASTAAGWFVFASAQAVWILFLGRIIDGMAAGNFPIAQSYLVDIAGSEKERTANLGMIGAVFGIGFIVGPVIGAALSTVSPAFPFYFVGALATLNMIGAFFFLPETHKNLDGKKRISLNPFSPLLRAVRDKLLRSRYAAWFLFGIAIAGMQSVLALYLNDVYGFDSKAVGMIFTAMGIIMVFNQGFLLRHFWLKKFKESFLEVWIFLFYAVGFFIVAVPFKILFLFGMLIGALAQSTLRVVMSSRSAGIAGEKRRGEVLGIMASVLSLSMIGGPLLAGFLFGIKPFFPFLVSAAALLAAFFVMKYFSQSGDEVSKIDALPQSF
jgi:DHA1 family tetracycline resistance protein-like MFS transporter